MKALNRIFVVASLTLLVGFSTANAQDEDLTIKGEVVDLSCYLSHGGKGRSHKTCAQQCAKRGLPIGVLTETGDVYLLLEDHNNAEPYDQLKNMAGDQAEVKGKKATKGGVNGIVVGEVKGQ